MHFAYAQAKLARSHLTAGQGARLSVLLKNEGSREAAEVVQVYARRSGAMAPWRRSAPWQVTGRAELPPF
ncbi:hypothetical protein HLB44_32445 [Aquincola sp. S2]|uniref:Fibronectin type III-like domain-containing protein n=1 Tax=Pseudaquabacterium terrae TaxID=2732868 RepID=A0ABX2ETF4_9BURK|nr:hypothetical protein [Aquabacterium terrae]NRF71709.1 hypothetical protein [Aquabacterium terrae]